ncbi:uncharacterized protein LOC109707463 [Ananas comosus]|uniref:Uncharacterized protein LOC109707463 n=1 Tax=Ananas comosus TaxID=4615 RepID=A0A6P5ELI2_ANACO|nr:uncharacterized protein LOC109707463 [Ananas comosus]
MQQRRRPTGTDGSDFSYRMVVDSRYTKVAKGKSRLASLIVSQAVNQVIGFLWVFLSISQEHEVDELAILSVSVGLVSLLIGELGRRRSQVISLRMYTGLSSIATLLSVGSFVRSDLFTKVIHHQTKAITTHEIVGAGHVLLGVLLQAIVIGTTVALVHNMSPKRAS